MSKSKPFTHLDESGAARQVDVSGKAQTIRDAVAEGYLCVAPSTMELLKQDRGANNKGEIWSTARIAGIMAAKKVAEIIPLCHQVPLSMVKVSFDLSEADARVRISAQVRTLAATGVEMEALTAVTSAALTVYDMIKSHDKSASITDIRLIKKSGGKSGEFLAKDHAKSQKTRSSS